MLDELLNTLKSSFSIDNIELEELNGLHNKKTLTYSLRLDGYDIKSSCIFGMIKTVNLSINDKLINETTCVNLTILYSYEVQFFRELCRLHKSLNLITRILSQYLFSDINDDIFTLPFSNKYPEVSERLIEFDVIRNNRLDLIGLEQLCHFYNKEFDLPLFQTHFINKMNHNVIKLSNLEFQC